MKLFQKKMGEDGDPAGKGQKAKSPKKSASLPSKPKKIEPARKASRKSDEPRFKWWKDLREYLREVVYELRKVIWPTRKETIGSTSVVLVIVILAGLFLGAVDVILSRLVRFLTG
ncbi:MAG TPA: preprotein translocase subunit SecE [Syntrophobacteraceae bacterium]|nr:preprotein translocase subunit SecE [Syntrophobacteraceae bacterium]